jgi:LPXTG-motif cell wall-anchored protein
MVVLIFMTTWVYAQPLQQQDTPTPEATTIPSDTPVPTLVETVAPTTTATATATVTAVAPAVSSLATPVATPSTLPQTGASDDNMAALSMLLMAAGVVILISLLGFAIARRSH